MGQGRSEGGQANGMEKGEEFAVDWAISLSKKLLSSFFTQGKSDD